MSVKVDTWYLEGLMGQLVMVSEQKKRSSGRISLSEWSQRWADCWCRR